jgi:hypothetical protein
MVMGNFPPDFASTPSFSLLQTLTTTETETIFRINLSLQSNGSRIEWNPTHLEMQDKLAKNPDAADESKRLLKIKLDAVGGR